MNQLWGDIQAQPENLQHVITHLLGTEYPRLQAAAQFLNNDKPVALIGVGSAAYLCHPAEVYLSQNGRPASVSYAPDALYNLLPALKYCNVVINTRSGETIEIVKLGQALDEKRIPFIAITNEPESTLARLATHFVWTDSRKDELVSINIVTSMMLATTLLCAQTLGQLDALRPHLERLPGQMAEIVRCASERADEIGDYFGASRPIYLLYRSMLKGAAFNGRLVLEEIARTPGIAMECGDFRQGPNEVIDERFAAVMYVPEGKQGELNLSLSLDILESGGKVMAVGKTGGWNDPRSLVFPFEKVRDELMPVLAVVPAQVLAYKLAERQGYTPGEVRYISKVILTEEGIPNKSVK